ncbi:DUF3592 domain-containing protein [Nocardiopsis sp. RSe5-2]|uniref:DUF3592 domain-containing protein n=1 Tax=Nocardiopsis endophytica TaxID=3018445 RepID=A0ABT4U4N2_9ACTN|nr:DUF3592 domain-containing protein [Nocardiopsis endophytica]MDA2811918.1 DUF3592 domain-containing protein [Nocardiopsis endophytica]
MGPVVLTVFVSEDSAPTFGAIGLFWIVVAALMLWRRRRYRFKGVTVPGRVVALRGESGEGDNPVYYPVVDYRTADGRPMRRQGSMGAYPARFTVGQEVQVTYLSKNPERIQIRGEGSVLLGGIFGVIGVACLCAAVAIAATAP